jgi:type I restriction enzyme S subunit
VNSSANWKTVTLGDVAKWSSGGTPTSSNNSYYGGSIPWAVIGDLNESQVIDTEKTITELGLKDSSAKIVPIGTVMLAMYGASIGKTGIVARPMATNQAIATAQVDDSILDNKYLLLYLQSQKQNFINAGKGGAQPNISQGIIKSWPFLLPTLGEQRTIVATLEDQLSRLEKAREELLNALENTGSLMLSVLEESVRSISQECYRKLATGLKPLDGKRVAQRGWSPQCLPKPQSSIDKWAVLKTTAIQHMRFEPWHNKELPPSLEPKENLQVRVGDFLMTTTGPRNRCGIVCHVKETPPKLMFSGKILRMHPDQELLNPNWLEAVLASPTFNQQLEKLKVGGSDSSVSIGNQQVLDLDIPIPSLAIQEQLVNRIRTTSETSQRFEKDLVNELSKIDVLRLSLLNAAFTGKLKMGEF